MNKEEKAKLETPSAVKPGERPNAPKKSGGTVTVACKMPNGILARVFELIDGHEPVLGGGSRAVKVGRQIGETVKFNGFASEAGRNAPHLVVGGYGLTPGVDADFFELWLEQNKDADYVKNKIVFARSKPEEASDMSKEHSSVKSGMEALDPKNLPVKGVATASKAA